MRYYSTKQAAKIIGYTPASVKARINEKRIRGVKIGRDWFIPEVEIERFIKSRKPKKPARQ